jgi:YidC/Oxa1 family membrane protein insertase
MEKRLLLAFLLMGAVLFLTPYFYQPEPPAAPAEEPQPTEQVQSAPAPPPAEEPVAAPAADVASPDGEPVEAVSAEAERDYRIETDVFRIVFSNRGAVVKSWVLKDYVDTAGERLELVNQRAVETVGYPFSLDYIDTAPAFDANSALFAATLSEDGLGIEFEASNGVTSYKKAFRFGQNDYLGEFSSQARHNGRPLPHLLVWRGGFGDLTVPKASTKQHSFYYDVVENDLVINDPDDAEDGPITASAQYTFAGLEDAYFAAVALPQDGQIFTVRTFTDMLTPPAEEKPLPYIGAAVGGEGANSFPLFVGPKDVDLLKEIDPKLEAMVDFGWFAILAKPIFLALKWVDANWTSSYGWAIVLLTIAINTVLFPLKLTSLKSMKKMQAVQPEIKKIQDKYKGLSMRDPKKQQQNEEMMALYQKHGVNPMGGCLPMVLQIPFFFAFYKVLTVAIELRGAEWLWVSDLSQPETLPIRILPVAMIVSQFAMQKMTPATTVNPSQQRIMYMMPLMMGFIFYGMSSGLVLYWLTSNVVGVGQQLLINRIGKEPETPKLPEPDTKPKRKGRKK